MEIELRRLIGLQVIVMGPSFIDNEKLESVKLLAVEDAGIWIQSQEAVDRIVGGLKRNPPHRVLPSSFPTHRLQRSSLASNPPVLKCFWIREQVRRL